VTESSKYGLVTAIFGLFCWLMEDGVEEALLEAEGAFLDEVLVESVLG
jgi:hypothetical protein